MDRALPSGPPRQGWTGQSAAPMGGGGGDCRPLVEGGCAWQEPEKMVEESSVPLIEVGRARQQHPEEMMEDPAVPLIEGGRVCRQPVMDIGWKMVLGWHN